MAKKMIPCRVCGKDFEPCAYCQSHADTFRWRNFACSKECAYKYIEETVDYRNSLRKTEDIVKEYIIEETVIPVADEIVVVPKKRGKRTSMKIVDESIIEELTIEE